MNNLYKKLKDKLPQENWWFKEIEEVIDYEHFSKWIKKIKLKLKYKDIHNDLVRAAYKPKKNQTPIWIEMYLIDNEWVTTQSIRFSFKNIK